MGKDHAQSPLKNITVAHCRNDYYPQRYDCADPDEWHTVVDYYDYHMQVDSSQPFYVPGAYFGSHLCTCVSDDCSEMQGGSLNGWGPGSARACQ